MPRGAEKSGCEGEVSAVIGTRARHVAECRALALVAGYAAMNDLNERPGRWTKGKRADSFGPWLVMRDGTRAPQGLLLWLAVIGQRVQDGSTRKMTHREAQQVSSPGRFKRLYPGDLISTGTPGVGMGMTPPRFLKPGGLVKPGIANLGTRRHPVEAEGCGPSPCARRAVRVCRGGHASSAR